MKKNLNNDNPLDFTISPETVFISTNPDQSSYANISVNIENMGAAALNVNNIAITLPPQLAPYGSLGSITPVAGQPDLWSFGPLEINSGEYDADPQSGDYVVMNIGDTWQFTLQMVTLVSTIATPAATVTAVVTLEDGSSVPATMNVDIDSAIASIISFNSQPANITLGQTATLTWQCEEMSYCIISPIDDTHRHESGSTDVQPYSTTNYTLYAYGDGVILSAQWAVTVDNPQIIDFGGPDGNTYVNWGDNIVLSWLCNQFTGSISLVDNTGVVIPTLLSGNNTVAKGSVTVGPIITPTTFTFTAYGNTKEHYDQRNPTININDVTASFTANPDTGLWQGDKVVLTWDIVSASAVNLSPAVENGPSLQNLSGSVNINPENDITYTLSVSGFTGSQPSHQDIPVQLFNIQQVSIASFTQTPPQIVPFGDPNQATLAWNVTAQTVSIDNGIGAVNPVGSCPLVAPPNSTTYTLAVGTNQNPGLMTTTLTIINAYGPFVFNSFAPSNNITGTNFMVANPDAMKYLAPWIESNYTPILSGVTLTNTPAPTDSRYVAFCSYSPLSGQSFMDVVDLVNFEPLTFEWTDPNNQTGTIMLTPLIANEESRKAYLEFREKLKNGGEKV